MDMTEEIDIEVAFALPDQQQIVSMKVAVGTTALEAVQCSGLLQQFPMIEAGSLRFGVYGKLVSAERVLRPHDRVEIYRPLLADPKEVRRRRALAGK
jgi:putative ubiquitin-RnfH superfamily antitoxin RatB of RatAB toxin-antitoxin module